MNHGNNTLRNDATFKGFIHPTQRLQDPSLMTVLCHLHSSTKIITSFNRLFSFFKMAPSPI